MIADALAALCRPGTGLNAERRRDAAEKLYALNRGALRQNGIRLPAEITVVSKRNRRAGRIMLRTLVRMGFENISAQEDYIPRFAVTVTIDEESARTEIYDRRKGSAVLRESISLPSLSRRDIAAFAEKLEAGAFTGR
jgi:hypothetical protein